MQSWVFWNSNLNFLNNVKSGDSWLRYWIMLWFPHTIGGVLHFNAEWLPRRKHLPHSLTLLSWVTERTNITVRCCLTALLPESKKAAFEAPSIVSSITINHSVFVVSFFLLNFLDYSVKQGEGETWVYIYICNVYMRWNDSVALPLSFLIGVLK